MDSPNIIANSECSAYPVPENQYSEGLTKREYFAGIALQGLISNGNYDLKNKCHQYAIDAIKLADALLNELNNINQ